MKRNFNVLIEKDEDGWFVSSVVELPGCHTQAKNLDQLMERTKEAIHVYLESAEGKEISEEFVGMQQINIEV
ncbi:MAG: type II toxin-antitoxin system HicB family antitoxin [Candidatus Nanoarchaeia archaeon]